MSSRVSFISWGEGSTLALVGHPSGDNVTTEIPYEAGVLLNRIASHHIFSYWLVKIESDFIVRSDETALGRSLVVAVVSVDTYHFLYFSDLTCQLEDTGIGVFWLHCVT